jgi:1,2-diacylglycerol 3-beta-galactosyltransferase
VDQLYVKLKQQGVDATVCVVCGRNEKLKGEFDSRDWDAVQPEMRIKKRTRLLNLFRRVRRSRKIDESVKRAEEKEALHEPHAKGNVDVVGLGFIEKMPEYMVAADILVTKAGPGTIAEAASVGLPLMLTR